MSIPVAILIGEHITDIHHSYQGDCCHKPVMMSKVGEYNTMYVDGGSAGSGWSHSRHRSLTIPRPDRRVIFPSLHVATPPSHPQPKSGHDKSFLSKNSNSPEYSPTDVNATLKAPLRANSLDGILIPLPRLSPTEVCKSNEEFASPISLNQRREAQEKKWAVPPSRSKSMPRETKSSKSHIFGDVVRRRTYYPAASVPTPVSDKKSPSHSKPLCSILRRKMAPLPSTTSQQSSSKRCDGTLDLSTCSPAVPTLASPASIKSLQGKPRRNESDGQEGIGESVDDLEHISNSPKILPRKQRILKRNQSATKVEEELSKPRRDSITSSSHDSSVSRHASLECLPNNRRISFDPHITVYEFGVTNYERKGGEKWFSGDQLTQFKQEAIQRIRLRSTKIIPTGTGRALTVTPTKDQVIPVNSKQEGKSKGSVSFNHPALGCEDEFDPESRNSRKSSIKDAVRDHATAAHIRNILVVDCHEIFLALFKKSLKHMVPHASVATARSSEEAMTRIEAARKAFPLSDGGCTHGFDIIIIEERLRGSFSVQQMASGPNTSLVQHSISTQTAGDDLVQRRWDKMSGSALTRHLVESEHELSKSEGSGRSIRGSLLVGVSARLLQDREKLEKSGADCVWGKPPPEMNTKLRNELLQLLMKKRNTQERY